MSDEIAVAVSSLVHGWQPVPISITEFTRYFLPPQKRRIADDRIESRIVPPEHLRKLNIPVKWGYRMLAGTQAGGSDSEFVPLCRADARHPAFHGGAALLPRLRLVLREE